MIKRIWKVIALFGSMVLLCGCGKEKLSDEEILQKINTAGKCGENLEWQLYDGAFGITLEIGGNGQMDDYSEETVPWKAGKKYILDFAIGEGVSSLGENALNGCEKLKWVCLPEGVVTIGNNAFDKCVNIWDIDLPDSIQSIGDEAFKDCHKLRQIELPENLTYLGSGTFDNCTALEEILIPSSVEYIGEDVFKDCKQLKHISYTGSQEEWKQIKIEENNDDLKEIPVKYNVTAEKENDIDTNDGMDEEVAAQTEDLIKETESAEGNTDIESEMNDYSDEMQEPERTIKVYFSEEASQKNLEQIKNTIEKEPAVDHIEQAGNEEAWQEFTNDYFQGSNSADTENPLSDDYSYFIVYLKENTDGEALAQYIKQLPYVSGCALSE